MVADFASDIGLPWRSAFLRRDVREGAATQAGPYGKALDTVVGVKGRAIEQNEEDSEGQAEACCKILE